MPQIAQQDYKVIAPKPGRNFSNDAAALAEVKKSILAGIGFDCLIKDTVVNEGDIDRVLGFFEDGSSVAYYSLGDTETKIIDLLYTVEQYQGLAAVQEALDEVSGESTPLPEIGKLVDNYLVENYNGSYICVDGKYLTVTGSGTIEALAIAETGPVNNFINITWEDAQKLIGLPLV